MAVRHVAIEVGEIRKAVAFYQDVFALDKLDEGEGDAFFKIRVNAINPGLVATEGYQTLGVAGSDFETQGVAQTPLGRVGQPDDIAPVVAFLASSESAWVTGETVRVAGGFR